MVIDTNLHIWKKMAPTYKTLVFQVSWKASMFQKQKQKNPHYLNLHFKRQ